MKIYNHITLVIGFLFLFNAIVCGQTDFYFHHLNTSNGLPDNSVSDIFQDGEGYLWFCTDDGLMKFDGVKSVIYRNKRDDQTTISNSLVTCVNEDNEGNIWVGTFKGLSRINAKDGSITRFDTLSNKETIRSGWITTIAISKDGTVWIGTGGGLFKYIANKNRFEYVLHREIVNRPGVLALVPQKCIVFDKDGNIYVGMAGSIYVSDDNGQSFQELDLHHQTIFSNGEEYLSCLKIIGDDLWYSDYAYTHIYRRNLTTGKQTEYVFNKTELNKPTEVFNDLCLVNEDELWLAGYGKVSKDIFILNTKTGVIQKLNPQLNKTAFLLSGQVTTIVKDRQKTIWIGGTTGVDYYNPEFSQFKTYSNKPDDARSYQGGKLSAICEDNLHEIWIGGDNGLSCFNESTQQFTRYKIPTVYSAGDKLNTVIKLFGDSSGLLWISTKAGVIQFNTETKKFVEEEKNHSIKLIYTSDKLVVCFAEDHSGNIWMGLWQSGILKYDHKTGKIFRYSQFSNDPKFYIPHEWAASLIVDSANNLWIGYNDYGGFAKWNLNNGKFDYYSPNAKKLSDPTINQIFLTKNQVLFATYSGGISVSDPFLQKIKIYGPKEGLISDRISGIMQASDQTIWLTTPFGLSHIDIKKDEIQNFYTREINSKFNPDAFCITPKNQILSGSENALVVFSIPKKLDTLSIMPSLSSFKVEGKDFYSDWEKPVKLKYWQNNFSFEFSSLNFIDPQSDHFAYKLEGYDKNWVDAGDRRFVNYTNMPGGKYVFKVKVQNANGLWSKTMAERSIVIATAFYNTWWFYFLCGAAIFFVAYSFYRYRVKQFLAMQNVRQKISTDLHDDIGSTLSSITMMSAVAKKKIATQPGEAINLAEKMEDASRQMITTMSDIVWSIKPGNDTLEQLISRLREYMHSMMENIVETYSLKTDEHILNATISINLRRDIYLIGKEIIHNAAKYAQAKYFEMQFEIKNNKLVLNAVDNGKGFDISTIKKGNGFNNIYQRTNHHHGLCKCESSVGKETKWHIEISLSA